MKINIDVDACVGCGSCVALCPEVFQLGADEKAYVVDIAKCSDCDCSAAADICPVEAITIEK